MLIKEYAYEEKITGLSIKNINFVGMYNIVSISDECHLLIRNINTRENYRQPLNYIVKSSMILSWHDYSLSCYTNINTERE